MRREIRSLLSTERGHSLHRCLRKDLVPCRHQMSVSCALASLSLAILEGMSCRGACSARGEAAESRTECHQVSRNRRSTRHASSSYIMISEGRSAAFRASARFRIRYSCQWHDASSRCPWVLKTRSTLLSPCTKCRNHRVPCRRTQEERTRYVTWFASQPTRPWQHLSNRNIVTVPGPAPWAPLCLVSKHFCSGLCPRDIPELKHHHRHRQCEAAKEQDCFSDVVQPRRHERDAKENHPTRPERGQKKSTRTRERCQQGRCRHLLRLLVDRAVTRTERNCTTKARRDRYCVHAGVFAGICQARSRCACQSRITSDCQVLAASESEHFRRGRRETCSVAVTRRPD